MELSAETIGAGNKPAAETTSSGRPSALNMESPYSNNPSGNRIGVRPPKPVNKFEELRFPDGFLSPSDENKEKQEAKPAEKPTGTTPPQKEPEAPAKEAQTVPQTTLHPILPDDDEPNYELLVNDQSMVYTLLIALLALIVFMFSDYRYRCRLQNIVNHNRQLLAPDAVPSDFDAIETAPNNDLFGSFFASLFSWGGPPITNYSLNDWTDEDNSDSVITSSVPPPISVPSVKNDGFYV